MVDKKKEHIDKSEFEFVQAEKKLYDKKFETKPIGYFKDAMIRFSKNKTNVIASAILFTLILLSIFVPILSTKNSDQLEEQLSFLPPRIPILEDLGFADGTKKLYDQPVDENNIDLETGLALPTTVDQQYILMDTLENYYKDCTEKDELCVGGQNQLRLDSGSSNVTVESNEWLTFSSAVNSRLVIDVDGIDSANNTKLNIVVGPISAGYETIFTITEPGVYTINPFEELTVVPFALKVRLEFVSDDSTASVLINSVSVTSDSEEEFYNYYAEGYKLSQYSIISAEGVAGSYVRSNGQRLMASFKYDAYGQVFGERTELAFSAIEYDSLIAEYSDVCVQSPDPNNPEGWLFSEGCPIVRVIKQNESVVVNDVEYFSYNLVLDYKVYMGYDEVPYFLFGTDQAGRDMVKLIWIGLRTSLSIGLLVAVINIAIGIVFGAISGYYGGQVDIIMQRFSEIVGRIPWLVTLSIFIALVGPGIETLIYVMIVSGWIGVAAVTRTQFYRYKGREYVLASRTLGAKDGRLIFRHILPNGIGTIITSSILMVPTLIFTEATLSYLGFGIGHGQSFSILGIDMSGVSIGVLLSDGRNQLRQNPHLTLFPALIISILMITFNMFGNALRDAFNPALRGSE
jgi:oligopeptide transport system permease protein